MQPRRTTPLLLRAMSIVGLVGSLTWILAYISTNISEIYKRDPSINVGSAIIVSSLISFIIRYYGVHIAEDIELLIRSLIRGLSILLKYVIAAKKLFKGCPEEIKGSPEELKRPDEDVRRERAIRDQKEFSKPIKVDRGLMNLSDAKIPSAVGVAFAAVAAAYVAALFTSRAILEDPFPKPEPFEHVVSVWDLWPLPDCRDCGGEPGEILIADSSLLSRHPEWLCRIATAEACYQLPPKPYQ
jgi:hypothetical protein